MQNRARDFLKKIAKLAPTMEENVPSILIVSHGGRVSVQGVKSLGGHFACLCRGLNFVK